MLNADFLYMFILANNNKICSRWSFLEIISIIGFLVRRNHKSIRMLYKRTKIWVTFWFLIVVTYYIYFRKCQNITFYKLCYLQWPSLTVISKNPSHTFNFNSINRYLLLFDTKYVEVVKNALKQFQQPQHSIVNSVKFSPNWW